MASRKRPLTEGYDYQFVDPGPTSDQKCPICYLVVRDAHQVTCCGKLFCLGCLRTCLNRSKNCPLCRAEVVRSRLFRDTRADREILDLKVYCSNKSAGCDWNGELRSLDRHLNECVYQDIECNDCHQPLLQPQLQKHKAEDCPERRYSCSACNAEGTYRSITTEHQNACPEKNLMCQNAGCGVVVKRRLMASHTDICPKEKVKCPFYYQGCGFICERENAFRHIQGNVIQHIEVIRKNTPRPTAPVTMKIDKFALHKTNDENWLSNGFYTGPGGYRVRLLVYPNGFYSGKGSHISVFINLMPGEHDGKLTFPMKGMFRIELLNQMGDGRHHGFTVSFLDNEEQFLRKHATDKTGCGEAKFIEHSSLVDESRGIRYLNNDEMYFRVMTRTYSTKPWLVETV